GRVSIDSWDQQVELRTDVGSVETSSYSRVNTHFAETNYDLLLNYNQTFGKFAVRALLGGNVRQQVNSGISSASNGGLVVPSYFALAN
ncbi:hypothetical protein ACE40V_24230, partial [Salmonella enterica]|uniref:hypothetical protein n=1 Tax=Salmonella enterica TaxID=28901 RepID=UPI003D2C723A